MKLETKAQVIAKLADKEEPRNIADELELSLSAVLRVKTEYDSARANNTVSQLINMDEHALNVIGKTLAGGTSDVEQRASELIEEIMPLKKLQNNLVDTAELLTSRLRLTIAATDDVDDLRVASTILADLNRSFFNDAQTQVNIQNNYGNNGDTSYGEFLNDKPGTVQ